MYRNVVKILILGLSLVVAYPLFADNGFSREEMREADFLAEAAGDDNDPGIDVETLSNLVQQLEVNPEEATLGLINYFYELSEAEDATHELAFFREVLALIARSGRIDLNRLCLRHPITGVTLLDLSIMMEDVDTLRNLLRVNSFYLYVNENNGLRGSAMLMAATGRANNGPIIEVLLEAGIDPNLSETRLRPLEQAVLSGNREALEILLRGTRLSIPVNLDSIMLQGLLNLAQFGVVRAQLESEEQQNNAAAILRIIEREIGQRQNAQVAEERAMPAETTPSPSPHPSVDTGALNEALRETVMAELRSAWTLYKLL